MATITVPKFKKENELIVPTFKKKKRRRSRRTKNTIRKRFS